MRITKYIYNKFRNVRSLMTLSAFKVIYGEKVRFGKKMYVRKSFTLTVEDEGHIIIGDSVFFNNFCSLNSLIGIEIGSNCIFGENVKIYDHNHKYESNKIPINNQGFTKAAVKIGRNSWIGSNVTILKGVSIGEHCVIGAGCVVYKDVPDNSVIILQQETTTKVLCKE